MLKNYYDSVYHTKEILKQLESDNITDKVVLRLLKARQKYVKRRVLRQNKKTKVLNLTDKIYSIAKNYILVKYKKTLQKQELKLEVLISSAIEEQQLLLLSKLGNIHKYRYLCRFKLENIPLELIKGYNLLCKLKIYNRKYNPNGVVKDHRLSIKEAFDNKYSPSVIGHPANCEFLTEYSNIKKSDKSSITYQELLVEINRFNSLLKNLN